jgi:hypothetical protein
MQIRNARHATKLGIRPISPSSWFIRALAGERGDTRREKKVYFVMDT